jgi:dinuclear metal center YbgI/SA1388 family protein
MSTPLDAFCSLLDRTAPLSLAESWDNVGLLVCPERPDDIARALFTIDLTEPVLREAERRRAQLIVAYHPPIFSALKRVTPADRTGLLLVQLLAARLCVYSPHTALDAVAGGVNDWLAGAFGPANSRAILPSAAAPQSPDVGQGRLLELDVPLSLEAATQRVKEHLQLSHVRLAPALDGQTARPIRTVALCAGAGGSVLMQTRADLLLTGEMRHHDVLQANSRGSHVMLTEHSNSERGYLPHWLERIKSLQDCDVELLIAEADREPLGVV